MSAHKNFFQTSDFLLMAVLIICIILELFFPSSFGVNHFLLKVIGIIFFCLSWILIFFIKFQFKKYKQKSGPGNETTFLIVGGLYKYSRNPIYLVVIVIFISFGLIFDSLWIFFGIIPLFILIQNILIIPEEKYLQNKFGDKYLEYLKKVRRWF